MHSEPCIPRPLAMTSVKVRAEGVEEVEAGWIPSLAVGNDVSEYPGVSMGLFDF